MKTLGLILLACISLDLQAKGKFTSTNFGFEHVFFEQDFGSQFTTRDSKPVFGYHSDPNTFSSNDSNKFFAYGPYESYPKSGEYSFSFKFKGRFLTGIHHDTSCRKRNIFKQCTDRHDRWYAGSARFDVASDRGARVIYQERLSSEDIRVRNNFSTHPDRIPTGVTVTDMGEGRYFFVHAQRLNGGIKDMELRVGEISSRTYLLMDFEGAKVTFIDLGN